MKVDVQSLDTFNQLAHEGALAGETMLVFEQELRAALDELVVDRADQTEADAEQIF